MIRYKRLIFSSQLLIAMVIVVVSCNKDLNRPPLFKNTGEGTNVGLPARKVLVISIDGATGSEIREIAPPNIINLQPHSKYSYFLRKGDDSTDAGSWVSLLTGIGYNRHQISDSSFQPENGNNLYPTLFNYISHADPSHKTAMITPWADLANYTKNADYDIVVNNDEAVKDSAVSVLNRVNALTLMVLDFNEVEIAGNSGGFSASNPSYKSAVMKVDGYIGKIMNALKTRKNYANEDWLVIITTNRGGGSTDPKNGFIYCYNHSFSKENVAASGYYTIRFQGSEGNAITAIVPNDHGLYNFGADQDFTLQMQIKFNTKNKWPGFFSKTEGLHGSNITGWVFFQSTNVYAFTVGGLDHGGEGKNQTNESDPIADGQWHTLTVSVKTGNDAKRRARLFVDGRFNTSKDITSNGNLNSPAPLTIGYVPVDSWGNADFYASGVEIFDVALDDQTIKDNIDLKNITRHPDYNNLIGYWPINSGRGAVLVNKAPKGYDMTLQGPYQWVNLGADAPANVVPPVVSPGITSSSSISVPIVEDISSNVLFWLKITPKNVNMDGEAWLDNFMDEIYNLTE